MKTLFQFYPALFIAVAIGCSVPATRQLADPRFVRQGIVQADDPGCEASVLVSIGGAFPKDQRSKDARDPMDRLF